MEHDDLHACRVLLVQPPIYDFALYDLFLKPYGLMRLESWFQDAGYAVSWLNCLDTADEATKAVLGSPKRKPDGTGKFFRQHTSLPGGMPRIPRRFSRYGIIAERVAEEIRSSRADIVCITTGMTYWYLGVDEVVRTARRELPGAKIVIGGIYATLMPEHAERRIAPDCIQVGDSISPLRRYLRENGFPVSDEDLPRYPETLHGFAERGSGVLRLNTGCPMHCDYCASGSIHERFRAGDPDTAVDFLERMYREKGIRHIGFYDDALLVNKEEVLLPFLEKVLRRSLKLSFHTPNAVHIRYMNRECAALMKRAGFIEVRMGYESSDEQFHLEHDRKFSSDDFSRALAALANAGFAPSQLPVYILAGLPRQDHREVLDSVALAAEAGASVSIAEYSPVPGSPMWDQVVEQCPYPLETEPLFHNNIFFSTEWEQFTREDMQLVKELARRTRIRQK